MSHFFSDVIQYSFLQYALIAAVLASVASGVVGSIIVVRRSTYIAGTIAHCVLAGLGAGKYAQTVWGIEWFTPLTGALITAVLAAAGISWFTVFAKERMDSVLSITWAFGMAIGITFVMKTPGYSQDLMSYLFGNILMISKGDLLVMTLLNGVILAMVFFFYHRIVAVCFHEESAKVSGIPVGIITFMILLMSAFTIVLLTQIVGIVLVIALLSIPAATASRLTTNLVSMMWVAVLVSLVVTIGGLGLSYAPQLPVGATIIELAVVVYLLVLWIKGKMVK